MVTLKKSLKIVFLSCFSLLLGACGNPPLKPSDGHIRAETVRPGVIPQPVKQAAPLPPPKPTAKLDTYSVVVTNVSAQEILFALARDAKINLDIHSGIQGLVTLNAIDQTLPQILTRIAKQVDMRYVIDGPNLVVEPDKPILRTYKVDYVNVSRDVTGNISIATQIATPGVSAAGGGAVGGGGNAATTSIASVSKNDLMKNLIQNIKDILNETDKRILRSESGVASSNQVVASGAGTAGGSAGASQASASRGQAGGATAPGGAGTSVSGSGNQALQGQGQVTRQEYDFKEASSVIANVETGTLTVRATARQHEKIQEFLDQVMTTAKRQVLIEVTVAEVRLSNEYQQGITWSRLSERGAGSGVGLTQLPTGTIAGVPASFFVFDLLNNTSLGSLTAKVRLLESFGTVKVLSSPRISVLNNQTAMLKVVDNRVYFTIKSDVIPSTAVGGGNPTVAVTTTPNTVAVGFVMSVTPQISDADVVLLNIRPSVSRITRFVDDPGPGIAVAGIPGAVAVVSQVPEIQTREMESMIRVNSGQIAVMGGLMQDELNNAVDGIPGLSGIPGIGELFKQRKETSTKTELVIFLRPIVVKDASIDGDYKGLRRSLPGDDFFAPSPPSASADVSGGK